MSVTASPALSVEGVTKRFGATTALDRVDLAIRPGSVHALIGMNGSGKSTLVKTLSGFHTPDEGRIALGPHAAEGEDGAGIAFVHQDLALVPTMTVVENLGLGRTVATRRGRIDWGSERRRARRALAPFRLERVVDATVGELSKAEATVVAIARALERCEAGCSVLVLDEPTSSLPATQTEHLLEVMRDCAARGVGVLFISHRLREVLAVGDEVTVLRNGRVSASLHAAGTSLQQLVDAMIGDASGQLERIAEQPHDAPRRAAASQSQSPSPSAGAGAATAVLAARGIRGEVVRDVDVEVRAGEIVGVVGLLGSGVEELGALLSTRQSPQAGTVELDGEPAGADALARIGFVPADRPARGVLAGLSARENATITQLPRFVRHGRIDRGAERRATAEWFERMTVQPPDPEADMLALSGGNQQKVLFARWLAVDPLVLVAEEPTQGVDVHAKAQILERLAVHAESGLAVVLLSGEPEEISPVCDRVIVLREGRVSEQFERPFATGDVVAAMH